jgi:hypothetical protein
MRIQQLRGIFSDELGKKYDAELGQIDKLSKQLGQYGDAIQYQEFAQQSLNPSFAGQKPLTPADAEKVMGEYQNRRKAAHDAFEAFLDKGDWTDLGDGPLAAAASKLKKQAWLSEKQAVKTTRKALLKMIDKILAGGYDFSDLEKGTHALRKDLRTFMIMVQSTYGIVRFGTGGQPLPPELEALATTKYASMSPVASVQSPLELPLYSYLHIVRDERVLGTAKDYGQGVEELADVLSATGVAAKKDAPGVAESLAARHPAYAGNTDLRDIAGTTRRIYGQVTGPLQELRNALAR